MLLLFLAAQSSGFFGFMTGNQLYTACSDPRNAACESYVTGIVDAVSAMTSGAKHKKSFCARPEVQGGQFVEVVVNYLRDHPASRSDGAAGLAIKALTISFPCRK